MLKMISYIINECIMSVLHIYSEYINDETFWSFRDFSIKTKDAQNFNINLHIIQSINYIIEKIYLFSYCFKVLIFKKKALGNETRTNKIQKASLKVKKSDL